MRFKKLAEDNDGIRRTEFTDIFNLLEDSRKRILNIVKQYHPDVDSDKLDFLDITVRSSLYDAFDSIVAEINRRIRKDI